MSSEEILAIEAFKQFNKEEVQSIHGLQGASPNRCWYLKTNSGSFVLRKCVRNNNYDWLTYIANVTTQLYHTDFPIQPLISSISGKNTILFENYYWQLRPFIEGRYFELGNESDEQEAIKRLLELHNFKDIPVGPKNPNTGIEAWIFEPDKTFYKTKDALESCIENKMHDTHLKTYYMILENSLNILSADKYKELPMVFTHGDFHCTNLIYEQNTLVSVLDFDTAEIRPRVYDLALAAYLLTRVKRGSFELDTSRTRNFIHNYSLHNKLTQNEIDCLIPLLQIHYLPTERYLSLMKQESPNLLSWYLNWAHEAATSVAKQMKYVFN
ncbi:MULTISPECIES: phosphotransferase [Bacillus cereus group]|uniref:phosphotransferase n=1 Tax=Bacillus cereus group TaxID=86661 RepID=UPI0001A1C69E|nr:MULTISPECIES: phosphotransferase [Bacillus cereus group]EEM69047.1 Spore coat protein S [Bacillus thuringiensis serovar andalousiensis BGSC 4AW1]MEB9627254.1 phosphotransferase [Bacillus anthracis]OUA98276.1 hypothetical protein BK714_12995 [Bacillus thuringiensis serovar oswaldocruzi]